MIKSARNIEIQGVDPLAESKDDGSPNFTVHPQAAAVVFAGFHCGVHREQEPGVQRASPFTLRHVNKEFTSFGSETFVARINWLF